MSEATMSRNVCDAIRRLDPQRVENRTVGPGTPDVNYLLGWIENKWLRMWPQNADTHAVKLDHDLEREQRVWLRQRWRMGGDCWVLLQVGRDWLLFTGEKGAEFVGRATRPVLYANAERTWCPLNKTELVSFLSRLRNPNYSSLIEDGKL